MGSSPAYHLPRTDCFEATWRLVSFNQREWWLMHSRSGWTCFFRVSSCSCGTWHRDFLGCNSIVPSLSTPCVWFALFLFLPLSKRSTPPYEEGRSSPLCG